MGVDQQTFEIGIAVQWNRVNNAHFRALLLTFAQILWEIYVSKCSCELLSTTYGMLRTRQRFTLQLKLTKMASANYLTLNSSRLQEMNISFVISYLISLSMTVLSSVIAFHPLCRAIVKLHDQYPLILSLALHLAPVSSSM